MSTAMSPADRTAFLREPRVAVLAVTDPRPERAPLAVPIWFDYDADDGLTVITSPVSQKGRAIEAAGRFSISVQDEIDPYRYVTVEGPLVSADPPDAAVLRRLAVRYLGEELGGTYADATLERDLAGSKVYVMRPEHWNTADLRGEMASLA